MFARMTFDELNSLNQTHRSMDFEDYFGEMKISEEEKERRIKLAEKLENEFLVLLSLVFTWQKYNQISDAKWQELQERFEKSYSKALSGTINSDSYLTEYIQTFSEHVTESTKNHQDDIYYYSSDRARFMAECEANNTGSYQEFKDKLKAGYTKKQWQTILDGHERETHHQAAGQIKNIWEPFIVGGFSMEFPRDNTSGLIPASEICGCRCSLKYIK